MKTYDFVRRCDVDAPAAATPRQENRRTSLQGDISRPLLAQQLSHVTIPLDLSSQIPSPNIPVAVNAAPTQHTFNVPAMGRILFILACIDAVIEIAADVFYLSAYPHKLDDPDLADNWNTLLYSLVLTCVLAPFLIWFLWTSIMFENKFEMVSFVVASAMITLHSWWQLWRHNSSVKSDAGAFATLGSVVFVGALLSSLFSIAFCAMSWYVCTQFGWHVYKRVGASGSLITMFTHFQVFKSILKVDLMWSLVLLLTGLFARVWDTVWGISLTITMMFASLAWAYGFTQVVRNERSEQFYAMLPFAFAEPVYIIYKLYQVIEHGDRMHPDDVNPLLSLIPHVVFTLPYFGTLAAGAIVVRIALLVFAWQCKRNFNKVCANLNNERATPHHLIEWPGAACRRSQQEGGEGCVLGKKVNRCTLVTAFCASGSAALAPSANRIIWHH
jgi:hypothetical protein